jgi:Uma2 family endonuclease
MNYPAHEQSYTYIDYLRFPDDKRIEIIDGVLYAMTPSPSTQHQRILRKLFVKLAHYLEGKDCEVFCSPYDVLLAEGNEQLDNIKTVVQPDILVVCDNNKITKNHCLGAPDLIVEIVSPSSPSIDYVKKLNLYEKHKVKEYWIVNYNRKQIMVYRLMENDEYGEPEIITTGQLGSPVVNGFEICLDEIF